MKGPDAGSPRGGYASCVRRVGARDRSRRAPAAALGLALLGSVAASLAVSGAARAETLESALARAYDANPTLNAQRAFQRATDENVPRARAGRRPRVSATADVQAQTSEIGGATPLQNGRSGSFPRGVGITVQQNIFDGNRTTNSIRQAESSVLSGRQTLLDQEQTTLQQAVESYMNVLRDTATLNLQQNNVEVLEEQLRQTRDRFNVGEVTRTDVAQAESRVQGGVSSVARAQAQLKASIAVYRQIIGVNPTRLAPGRPYERDLPRSPEEGVRVALAQHPAIRAALHNVDAALLAVKVTEGELAPTVALQGSVSQRYDVLGVGDSRSTANLTAQLNVPIYEGGEVYARVRQAKETLSQRRLEADIVRERVRSNVIATLGSLEAARAQIVAAQAQVQAAEIALAGVREEAKVGQRTTLDVLNAQQEVLNARVSLVTAQRDRVVASYLVAQALGRLTATNLRLRVGIYDPKVHFEQVQDRWYGLRTPDGR